MKLSNFTRNDKINVETLRSFKDWFIRATSRELDNYCTITYYKYRKPNQTLINELNTELEELNRNLNTAYEEENQMEINGIKSQIKNVEFRIQRESEEVRQQPVKVVVNEEDLPYFLRLIDESWSYEVYEAVKSTGLRLWEFINEDNIPVVETETGEKIKTPSPQWIVEDTKDNGREQKWTREYTR